MPYFYPWDYQPDSNMPWQYLPKVLPLEPTPFAPLPDPDEEEGVVGGFPAGALPPQERKAPASLLPDKVNDYQLEAYTGLGSHNERKSLLEQKRERAAQMRAQNFGGHTSILGAILGGFGGLINAAGARSLENEAEEAQAKLLDTEDSVRSDYAKAIRTSGLQKAGNLGVLSGDAQLDAFGKQAIAQDLNEDKNGLHGITLEQALERLELNRQREARLAAQGKTKFDVEKWDKEQRVKQGWYGLSLRQKEIDAMAEERDLRRDERRDDKESKSAVPGLEVEPGATPTADDAKRVKGVRSAANTLKSYTSQFRELYKRNGGSMTGAAGTNMRQLLTSMQLEAKTIAELGALSGPDQALMERISGANPTSAVGIIRDFFGVDDVGAAVNQLDKWVDTKVAAMNKTYGYREAGSGTKRVPADTDSMKPVGTTSAVNDEDRQALEWYRANPNDPDAAAIGEILRKKGLLQ